MHHNALDAVGCLFPFGRNFRLTYPLKPPHAGVARPHPVRGGRQQDLF